MSFAEGNANSTLNCEFTSLCQCQRVLEHYKLSWQHFYTLKDTQTEKRAREKTDRRDCTSLSLLSLPPFFPSTHPASLSLSLILMGEHCPMVPFFKACLNLATSKSLSWGQIKQQSVSSELKPWTCSQQPNSNSALSSLVKTLCKDLCNSTLSLTTSNVSQWEPKRTPWLCEKMCVCVCVMKTISYVWLFETI